MTYMIQFYLDHAAMIRVVAYTLLIIYFAYWSAGKAYTGRKLPAFILLLVTMFWVGSLHFALSRNPAIPVVFTTPILILLTLSCALNVVVHRIYE